MEMKVIPALVDAAEGNSENYLWPLLGEETSQILT